VQSTLYRQQLTLCESACEMMGDSIVIICDETLIEVICMFDKMFICIVAVLRDCIHIMVKFKDNFK